MSRLTSSLVSLPGQTSVPRGPFAAGAAADALAGVGPEAGAATGRAVAGGPGPPAGPRAQGPAAAPPEAGPGAGGADDDFRPTQRAVPPPADFGTGLVTGDPAQPGVLGRPLH